MCCHSLQPHTTVQGGVPGAAQGCVPVPALGTQDRLSLAPSEEALAPWEGCGWGCGWLLTQHSITAPSTARALQWVALASPESWLTEVLECLCLFPPLIAVPFPRGPALYRNRHRAAVGAAVSLEGTAASLPNADLLLFGCDPEFPIQKAAFSLACTGPGPERYKASP